jgi:hypothetical protein
MAYSDSEKPILPCSLVGREPGESVPYALSSSILRSATMHYTLNQKSEGKRDQEICYGSQRRRKKRSKLLLLSQL